MSEAVSLYKAAETSPPMFFFPLLFLVHISVLTRLALPHPKKKKKKRANRSFRRLCHECILYVLNSVATG